MQGARCGPEPSSLRLPANLRMGGARPARVVIKGESVLTAFLPPVPQLGRRFPLWTLAPPLGGVFFCLAAIRCRTVPSSGAAQMAHLGRSEMPAQCPLLRVHRK